VAEHEAARARRRRLICAILDVLEKPGFNPMTIRRTT